MTARKQPPAADPPATDGTTDTPPDATLAIDAQAVVDRAMSAAGDMTEIEETAIAEICASVRVLYHGLRGGPGRIPKRLADAIVINHALAALAFTYGGGVAEDDDE